MIIYFNLFSYFNFLFCTQLLTVIVLYCILYYLKNKDYIFSIDEFTLYFINIICFIFLFIRSFYILSILFNITKKFTNIKTDILNLFITYTISYTNYYNDIDDSNSVDNIVIHNNRNYQNSVPSRIENLNLKIIYEFKDIIWFYLSYFIYILLNDTTNVHLLYLYNNLIDNKIYENFIYNKFSYTFYNINNEYTKLLFINIFIKSLLYDSFNDNYLSTSDYNKCIQLIDNINKNMYDVFIISRQLNNVINTNNTSYIINLQSSLWITLKFKLLYILKIFSNLLIIISIILLINYYISYSLISLLYILIISFIYIYINHYNNNILKNYIHFNYNTNNGINIHKLITEIQNEINLILIFSSNKINIIYK